MSLTDVCVSAEMFKICVPNPKDLTLPKIRKDQKAKQKPQTKSDKKLKSTMCRKHENKYTTNAQIPPNVDFCDARFSQLFEDATQQKCEDAHDKRQKNNFSHFAPQKTILQKN